MQDRTVFGWLIAALVATGCGGPCGGTEDAAFEAAWRNDLETMSRLIAQDPRAARGGQCDPPQTAIGKFIHRQPTRRWMRDGSTA
jgi:hypothetical protein